MSNKSIAFIGGGAASLISSILIKRKYKDLEVVIFEHKNEVGKKLKMTGNGKCNIAPMTDNIYKYNNPDFLKRLFEDIPLEYYLNELKSLGILTKTIADYGYYPISESAPNVQLILLNEINRLGIKITNEEVIDYSLNNNIEVVTNNKKYHFDKIVIATGGLSHPESGSDGKMIDVLQNHGYDIKPLSPSLCPIRVKENVKDLFGVRGEASLSLYSDGKLVKVEDGEVMFKKDAISGICAMNISSIIARNPSHQYKIGIRMKLAEMDEIPNGATVLSYLLALVKMPLCKYVMKELGLKQDASLTRTAKKQIDDYLSNMMFTVSSLYDYSEAQVTCGGVSLQDINNDFSSKKEDGVYLLGEVLDIDGECGGYNLRYVISSAMKFAKTIDF